MIKQVLKLLFVVFIFNNSYGKSCSEYKKEFFDGYENKPLLSDFLKYWKGKVGADCKNTAGYYYYLSEVLDPQSDIDDILYFARKGLKFKNSSEYKPKLLAIIAEAQAIKNLKKDSKEVQIKSQMEFERLIKQNPNNFEVYARYAATLLYLGKISSAHEYAIKSININPNKIALVVLIKTSFLKGDYKKTIKYAEESSKYMKYISSNESIMLLVAISYAKLSDFEMSRLIMLSLQKNARGVDETKEFQDAWKHINYLYFESKKTTEGEIKNEK